MAAITRTTDKITRGSHWWTWSAIGNADTATEIGDDEGIVAFADKTVQVDGTFGGTTVTLEGSNDGASWFGLSDPQGTAISFTAAGLSAILENPRYIKPVMTGGAASSINVRLVGRAIIQMF